MMMSLFNVETNSFILLMPLDYSIATSTFGYSSKPSSTKSSAFLATAGYSDLVAVAVNWFAR